MKTISIGTILIILLGPPAFSAEADSQPDGVRPISARTIKEFLNNQDSANTIRAVPSFREGNPYGLKILSVKPESFFEKLGLKRGDILIKVEDRPIAVTKALDAFSVIEGKKQFEIEIERRGVVQKLRLAVGKHDFVNPNPKQGEVGYEIPLFAWSPLKIADFSYSEDDCSVVDAHPRLYGYQQEKGFGVFKIKALANCCQKIMGELWGASFLGEKTMTFSFKEEGEPCKCRCPFDLVYKVPTPKDFDFKECEILFMPPGATYQTLKARGQTALNQTLNPTPYIPEPQEEATPKLFLTLDRKEITEVAERFCKVTQRKCEVDPQVRGQITYWSSKPMSTDEALEVFSKLLAEKGYKLDIQRKGILNIQPSARQ